MIYLLLKLYARITIKIYCTRIIINKPDILKSKGPLLFASNHPNSFLDGIILTTLLDEPLYSLARGDAFKKKHVNSLLRWLKLLPVYRTSEGPENLEHNYTTFAACRETFKNNGIVLIFSEGRCENEWHLRPLKKGTARLAITSWEQEIPLKVIPTAFNYSSFQKFGKEVHLFFGETIEADKILSQENIGKQLLSFNEELERQLNQMVYEIEANDEQTIKRVFSIKKKPSLYLLFLPALLGAILHAPLFFSIKLLSQRFRNSGHYDSIFTVFLLMLFPVYLAVLTMVAFNYVGWISLLALVVVPFTAWAATQAKYQLDI